MSGGNRARCDRKRMSAILAAPLLVLGHGEPHKHIKVCASYTHAIMCYKQFCNYLDLSCNLLDLNYLLQTVLLTKDLV